jgi:succinoglycan biosynthesis protein ExoU
MADETTGSVDVIIAAWNSAATIERSVRSALADPAVAKVIVIDDASTDGTVLAAAQGDDGTGRLDIETLPVNGGPSRARNAALDRSKAAWICVLDADDFFEGHRVSRLLTFAGEADAVADDILQVTDTQVGLMAPVPLLSEAPFAPWTIDFETFVARNITAPRTSRKELGFLKPIMRRSFLDAHRLRYAEHLRLGEDFALYASALARGAQYVIVPAQGYVSVVREGSLSSRHSKSDLVGLRDFDNELLRSEQLDAREQRVLKRHARSLDARVQWLEIIEAVKSRDAGRFARPFFRSPAVSKFLLLRLWEQARLRAGRS